MRQPEQYSTNYKARMAEIKARNEQTNDNGPVMIYVPALRYLERPEYKGRNVRVRSQAELAAIADGGPTDQYEIRERYALEHLKCFDCEINLQKLTPGEYYCPSCGDQFSE